jgi:hypothetical protein
MAQKKENAKQKRAIAALLSSKSIAEAAASACIGERTLHRWLDDPLFRDELLRAEGELIDAATRRLVHIQAKAITTMEIILDDINCSATAKLRAAQTVLDYLLRLRELRNIEQRLLALEEFIRTQRKA